MSTSFSFGQRLMTKIMESDISAQYEAATSAEDREDGLMDGFNIPLDAQTRALSARVKMPMARRIVALLSMSGIPGRYMADEEIESGVLQATDLLRKKASIRKAFLDFYNTLASAKGYSTPENVAVVDREVQESEVEQKKGDHLTKLFTTVLIELGMPASFAGVSAPSIVSQNLLKTAQEIEENGALQRNLRILALRLGIKADDVRAGVTNESDDEELNRRGRRSIKSARAAARSRNSSLDEAFDAGQDEFMSLCVQVAEALGIPADVMERRKAQVLKSLRARKQSLRNRASVINYMRRLLNVVQSNEVKAGEKAEAE